MSPKVSDFLYEQQSYEIRGAYKESIVEQALWKAFSKRKLHVERQKRITVHYEGEAVGVYQPDFVIDDCVLVELKCKPVLTKGDQRQFWQYLKGSRYRLGFLVHFSPERLEISRIVYDRARTFSANRR